MLRLPEKLRTELSKPYGRLYKDGERVLEKVEELNFCKPIAFVGDFVTYCAFKIGLTPEIVVVDGKTLRERSFAVEIPESYTKIYAKNPAGVISSELIKALLSAIDFAKSGKKVAILVLGEEDLAVMPLALLMPEGGLIIYGQPKEGVVALPIDSEKKVLILKLLKQMEVIQESEELKKLGVI
ncbi:MAG: DUF359 domain-containing protein [Archaeoglobaceae archaeon]